MANKEKSKINTVEEITNRLKEKVYVKEKTKEQEVNIYSRMFIVGLIVLGIAVVQDLVLYVREFNFDIIEYIQFGQTSAQIDITT